MEFEIKEYISISDNDFIKNDILTDVSFNGELIFKEVHINDIENDSIIMKYLTKIINENNIKKDNYEIYFQRNKEWFNKFIFYDKNKK